jgi:glycosyltransferase involved in cell wall biosynthesis
VRRVLVSAYACEPNRGSEGEIGWSLVHELARTNEVWVITRANNKAVHDAAFAVTPKPDTLNFIYYDLPEWTRWYKKGKRFFLVYYYLWQIGSSFAARKFVKLRHVDLVHHLTGGMDWMPSGLAFVDLPMVWGPVGSERTHPVVARSLPARVRIKELARKVLHGCLRHGDPLVRFTGRRATVILSHTPEYLPARYRSKMLSFVQTGVHPTSRFALMKTECGRGGAFTVVYAGELVHWKGAAYALQAFHAFARDRADARLVLIGDGPMRPEIERMRAALDLDDRVRLAGRLPMPDLIRELSAADVFLYPSYHHGLATVVLQAMLTGLPVVCIEGDAIGRSVNASAGITVPLSRNTDFIDGLAGSLRRLYDDEPLRATLARAAQARAVSEFSYEALGRGYEAVYTRAEKCKHANH